MNKENKNKLEIILQKVAKEYDFEICGLDIQTNQNPIILQITIKKTNEMIFQLMIVQNLIPQHPMKLKIQIF